MPGTGPLCLLLLLHDCHLQMRRVEFGASAVHSTVHRTGERHANKIVLALCSIGKHSLTSCERLGVLRYFKESSKYNLAKCSQ